MHHFPMTIAINYIGDQCHSTGQITARAETIGAKMEEQGYVLQSFIPDVYPAEYTFYNKEENKTVVLMDLFSC